MAAIAAAAMFLAAGCLGATSEYTINPDGGGSASEEVRMSRDLLVVMFGTLGLDIDSSPESAACEVLLDPEAFGSLFLEEALMAEIGVEAGVGIAGPPSLEDMGIDFVEETAFEDGDCVAREQLRWSADQADTAFEYLAEYHYVEFTRLDSQGWRVYESIDDLTGDEPFPGLDQELLESVIDEVVDISYELSVTMPGRPVDHNADRATSACDATTFRWNINIVNAPDYLMAETDGSEECEGWGIGQIVTVVLIGILAAAVVAGVLLYSSRHDRDPEPSDPESSSLP